MNKQSYSKKQIKSDQTIETFSTKINQALAAIRQQNKIKLDNKVKLCTLCNHIVLPGHKIKTCIASRLITADKELLKLHRKGIKVNKLESRLQQLCSEYIDIYKSKPADN